MFTVSKILISMYGKIYINGKVYKKDSGIRELLTYVSTTSLKYTSTKIRMRTFNELYEYFIKVQQLSKKNGWELLDSNEYTGPYVIFAKEISIELDKLKR